jgi:hypothetical protein
MKLSFKCLILYSEASKKCKQLYSLEKTDKVVFEINVKEG